MRKIISFLLLFCLAYSQGSSVQENYPGSGVKRYNGVQVYRLNVRKKEQYEALVRLYQEGTLDFWSGPNLNKFTDVMITPDQKPQFLYYLRQHGIKYTILMRDVERVIQAERERQVNWKRAQAPKAEMSLEGYNTFDDIIKWMRQLPAKYASSKCSVSVGSIGESYEGRPIIYAKISNVPPGKEAHRTVVMDAGIHAREWIAPATALWCIHYLLDDCPAYLTETDVYIIPLLNPDGYDYSMTSDRMWRKNRSPNKGSSCVGTDLNRNFGYQWGGAGTSASPCSEIFKGTGAFSEPEAKALKDFCSTSLNSKCDVYITLHSYGEAWYTQWGWTADYPPDYDEQLRMAQLATNAMGRTPDQNYECGSSTQLLYAAAGGSDDWTYGELGTIYSHCVELSDKGDNGFVLPANQIKPVGEEFCKAFYAVCEDLVKK